MILDRDGWRCVKCSKAGKLEVDHITPVFRGGAELDPSNCQTLCRSCHLAKTRTEARKPETEERRAWRELTNQNME